MCVCGPTAISTGEEYPSLHVWSQQLGSPPAEPTCDPTTMLPSNGDTAGTVITPLPVVKFHTRAPLAAVNAYTLPLSDPMYTMEPFGDSVGDDCTPIPESNSHTTEGTRPAVEVLLLLPVAVTTGVTTTGGRSAYTCPS